HRDAVHADGRGDAEVVDDLPHGGDERLPVQVGLEPVEQQQRHALVVAAQVDDQARRLVVDPRAAVEGHDGPTRAVVDELVDVERRHALARQLGGQVLGDEPARVARVDRSRQGVHEHRRTAPLGACGGVELSWVAHLILLAYATRLSTIAFPREAAGARPRPSAPSPVRGVDNGRPPVQPPTRQNPTEGDRSIVPDDVPDDQEATSALERALAHEQRYVDTVYHRIDELRDDARRRPRPVQRAGPSRTHQNRSERDAFATLYADRLAQLDAVEERLVFGRLDLDDGARRYVGRIGVSDAEQVPL